MIAVDTNVLLRYLYRKDDPSQSERAAALIDGAAAQGQPVFVSVVVLCELVWTLKGAYRLHHTDLGALLHQLLTFAGEAARPVFLIEHEDEVRKALDEYATGSAGFADYLIGRIAHSAGAITTYTFDRHAAAAATFKRVR